MRHSRKAGFTLIELLIVIAIITILALIAIPRFMEARVRANVSRIQADMRSLATAVEAYMLDQNNYPIDTYHFNNPIPGQTTAYRRRAYVNGVWNFNCMTTPVAYVTSVDIDDPFLEKATPNSANKLVNGLPPCFAFINFYAAAKDRATCDKDNTSLPKWGDASNSKMCPSAASSKILGGGDGSAVVAPAPLKFNSSHPNFAGTNKQNEWDFRLSPGPVYLSNWALVSCGPDRQFDEPRNSNPDDIAKIASIWYSNETVYFYTGDMNFYDPSNGTLSRGNIWRLPGGATSK